MRPILLVFSLFFCLLLNGQDPSLDKKHYKNDKYSLDFHYPNSWFLEEEEVLSEDDETLIFFTLILYSPEYDTTSERYSQKNDFATINIELSPIGDPRLRELDAFLEYDMKMTRDMDELLGFSLIEYKVTETRFMEQKGYKIFNHNPVIGQEGEEHNIFTIKNDLVYAVRYYPPAFLVNKHINTYRSIYSQLK